MNVKVMLTKRTDSDLISFLGMQDKPAATLMQNAVICYIHDRPISENLRNAILVKSDKNVQVLLRIKDEQVSDYIKNIPNGFKSSVIKNITRTMYSGALYGHQHEANNKIQLPDNFSERVEEIKKEQCPTTLNSTSVPSTEERNELLDIFNQMLG